MIKIRLYTLKESALYDFRRWVREHSDEDVISEADEESLTVSLKDGNRMKFMTNSDFMEWGRKNRGQYEYEVIGREPPGPPLFLRTADTYTADGELFFPLSGEPVAHSENPHG